MKLKRLVSTLIPALLLLAACAPAARPPAASGLTSTELNLYAWSEYVPQQLLDDFTAKYGVKVNLAGEVAGVRCGNCQRV